MSIGTWIAIALAALACAVAVLALLEPPVRGRHALTMELSLTLLRYDEGLAMLAAQTRRSDHWWEDVDPAEQHLIDRALSMWDLAAWYVATGRVERRAVLEVFRWNIVDLWERAYPYVLHRRVDQPSLWPSLTDLYLDAYAGSAGAVQPKQEPRTIPPRSISPEGVGEQDDDAVRPARARSVPVRPAPVVPEPEAVPAPAPEPEPAVVAADPWLRALREAGADARPHVAERVLMRPASRRVTEIEEEWPTGPGRRRVASARPAQPPRPSLEVDQVIDLTEARTTVRSDVSG